MIKPKRIAIVSVLKPVDEVRMSQKIGVTLAEAGYEVHVAGYFGEGKISGITLHPIFNFSRLSGKRLTAVWTIFRWFVKIRPHLIIVCTHELLVPALFYKIFRVKVIYDVQENYSLNIRHTNAFPKGWRNLIATYVEIKEKMAAPFIDHFILAEKGYMKELMFVKSRATVVENKALKLRRYTGKKEIDSSNKISLVFTGTIAETTGIFECLEIAEKLHEIAPQLKLTIAGNCQLPKTLLSLKNQVADKEWVELKVDDKPLPYSYIREVVEQADLGFIFYTEKLTENRIPTKLYEYLAANLIILLQDNPLWLEIASTYPAAIPIHLESFDPKETLALLKSGNFYTKTPGDEVLWGSESKKLVNIADKLLI